MSTVDLAGARWRKSSFSGGDGGGNDNCVEIALVCADWRKSTFSSGSGDDNCVEVALARGLWRKSSLSGSDGGGNDNCVEVAFSGPVAAFRDSKNAAGPVLLLPAAALSALLAATEGQPLQA